MKDVPALLRRGIRAGLVGPDLRDDAPSILWTVADTGWIFEARITNSGQMEYHGYPVRPTEAIAELVYGRYTEWAARTGEDDDRRAAIACRELYGLGT